MCIENLKHDSKLRLLIFWRYFQKRSLTSVNDKHSWYSEKGNEFVRVDRNNTVITQTRIQVSIVSNVVIYSQIVIFTQINISVIFMKLEGGGARHVCDIRIVSLTAIVRSCPSSCIMEENERIISFRIPSNNRWY